MQHISGRLKRWTLAILPSLACIGAAAAQVPPPPFGPNLGSPGGKAPQLAPVGRQASSELLYKPIAPCRAFGGQLVATNQIKAFLVSGNSNFTAQGGPSGGCGIPAYAKAVSISLSSGTSGAQGYLTAYATGSARPNQASLSYGVNPATTGSIVQLGTGGRINVLATAATRVTGDIAGYFVEPIQGMISSNGVDIYSGSTGLVSSTLPTMGVYRVVVDRDVSYCTPVATPYYGPNLYANAYAFDGNVVTVYTWYIDHSANATKPINTYVYLAVHC